MKILVTNDDGYQSEGIVALTDALVADGHEVWVCAPSLERSASSHAMTLRQEIVITEFGPQRYHCSGTPVDCILYATRANLFKELPDLVISGINHGFNISTDILYSGTVGAAREAALTGMHAMAVSCSRDERGNYSFDRAASFVIDHLDAFYELTSPSCILNINIPANGNGKWLSGVPAYLDYHDAIDSQALKDSPGALSLMMKNTVYPSQRCDTEQSDFEVVNSGYTSVTALAVLPPVNEQVQLHLDRLSREEGHV
jgi:5'-nucleotidase